MFIIYAIKIYTMLLKILWNIPDKRRAEWKMYDLKYVLFFSILAILSWATSYRKIRTFIFTNFQLLKTHFWIKWKWAPSYSTIRNVIHSVDSVGLEQASRKYAKEIWYTIEEWIWHICLDWKTVKGSYDNMEDQKAIQVFSAFLAREKIILASKEICWEKTNEIPIARKLIEELWIENAIFTADAMHCQKETVETVKKNDEIC